MSAFLFAFLVAESFACAAMGVYLMSKLRETGLRWAWRRSEPLRWRKCATCGGTGSLMLEGGKLSRIPPRLRSYNQEKGVFQAKLGSTVMCQDCQGLMRRWTLPSTWPNRRA